MKEYFEKFPKYFPIIIQLFVRYAYILIRSHKFEEAFYISSIVDSTQLFKDLSLWGRTNNQFALVELIQKNIIKENIQPEVIGISAIKEYMNTLKTAYNEGDVLSNQDAVRLGLWLESQGKLKDAQDLYYKYEMYYELNRLNKFFL